MSRGDVQEFCESVGVVWKAYATRIEKERVAPKIVLAQAFNNHVATVPGAPGKVTAFAPAASSLDEFKKIIKPLKPAC